MANSYKDLIYVVTFESNNDEETAIAAFASWLDADAFLDRKVQEEKQCNDCFHAVREEGFADCYLDPANPDQRDTYRIRKPL